MTPALDPESVAATNPAVDVKKLKDVEQIRQVLESAGVAKKADYRLSPPLGTGTNKPPAPTTVVRMSRRS
jgi:hypothetical protein